jgi:hypothetical protein
MSAATLAAYQSGIEDRKRIEDEIRREYESLSPEEKKIRDKQIADAEAWADKAIGITVLIVGILFAAVCIWLLS